MWVIAEYEATSLFSMKSSMATSSAGKTLLVPTPFALKMALLDIVIRTRGLSQGKLDFEWIKDLGVAVRPSEKAVVTNLFAKIQKPTRTDSKEGKKKVEEEEEPTVSEEEAKLPFTPTIAYREYVHLQGKLSLAFAPQGTLFEAEALGVLPELLVHLNYLGKRGGFFQLLDVPKQSEVKPNDFVILTEEGQAVFYPGLLQMLDDCGAELTFDKADIYSDKKIRLGKERVMRPIVLPYELKRSSRSYSYYERKE